MGFFSVAILYSEEEEPTRLDASRNSSRGNALLRVDGGEVRAGRPQHLLRPPEHLRTHRNVFLLYGSCDGTAVPKVHLVEKIPH